MDLQDIIYLSFDDLHGDPHDHHTDRWIKPEGAISIMSPHRRRNRVRHNEKFATPTAKA